MPRKRFVALWAMILLASVPALLIAFLGTFSRIMGDDWCYFSTALHLGGRDYFGLWMGSWNGSFTYAILHDALAPLGPEYIPPMVPAIIFALWLIGLTWLILLVQRGSRLEAKRFLIALILALLTLAAFFRGVYDWEAIYWYAASTRHSLPIGIFLIYLALSWEVGRRQHSYRRIMLFALVGAAACFVNAGLSEVHALLQVFHLTVLLAAIQAPY